MIHKLRIIQKMFKESKQYMSYDRGFMFKVRFWLGLPRAFTRFLYFSRNDPYWKP